MVYQNMLTKTWHNGSRRNYFINIYKYFVFHVCRITCNGKLNLREFQSNSNLIASSLSKYLWIIIKVVFVQNILIWNKSKRWIFLNAYLREYGTLPKYLWYVFPNKMNIKLFVTKLYIFSFQLHIPNGIVQSVSV